ncbi:MAG: O-methyltransferase [Haloferacaceae archaeon]
MVLTDDVARFVRAAGPDHDGIQAEMAAYAEEHGFPIIGPDAGGVLRLVARLTDARRIFEFGSGFGYSAYWFLQGMHTESEIVLTEVDADELDMAREFFERAGIADRAEFRRGDAMEIVDEYDGPFDVVLMDHQKARYADGFRRVREKVRPGGVVAVDNIMRGPVEFDSLLAYLEGGPEPEDGSTAGVAEFLDTVDADPAFETTVLPVGSGVSLSVKVPDRW